MVLTLTGRSNQREQMSRYEPADGCEYFSDRAFFNEGKGVWTALNWFTAFGQMLENISEANGYVRSDLFKRWSVFVKGSQY